VRNLIAAVERIDPLSISGRVAAVSGLLVEARGGLTRLAVGARAEIERLGRPPVAAEVVGFRDTRALMMPFGAVEGIAPGAEIRIMPEGAAVRPTLAWRGRIIDAFGEPIDGKGPLPQGPGRLSAARQSPRPPTPEPVSASAWTWVSAPWTSSPASAAASGWASSPARASASRCCSRCWPATPSATPSSSA
jgi:flagellar biosynthesis/type III secretory pathway ATPase